MKVLQFLGCSALLSASVAQAQLVNGDFATGDFTGWSGTNTVGPVTAYGVEMGGTDLAQVVPFDIMGTGTAVNCAEFQVGQSGGLIGGGPPAGIILYQYVPLNTGELAVSVDIAATCPYPNGDAGTFQLMLDGKIVASDAMGGIDSQTFLSSLSYTGTITGGTHEISVAILRVGAFEGYTPTEYLGNFQLTNTPEPSVNGLLLAGTTALFLVRLVRR